MFRRYAFSLVVAVSALSALPAAGAVVDPSPKTLAVPQADAPPPAVFSAGLVLGVERTLQTRWAAVDEVAPLPHAGADDGAQIAKRLTALRELNDFARMTIAGLTRALEGRGASAAVREQLDSVRERWSLKIADAVTELLSHPMVKSERWFVISRFGAAADRNGALLVQAADTDPTLQRRVLAILETLAPKGETALGNVELLARQVGPSSDEHASVRPIEAAQ